MPKHIKLYEDYTAVDEKGSAGHYSWQDVRDTIQGKLPFIIIDFKTKTDKERCIQEDLFDESYMDQVYYLKMVDGRAEKYPSVFIFADKSKLAERILDLKNRYDILRIVIGEYGKEVPKLYIDGDLVEIGKNLYSTINLDDVGLDDFYDNDSNYYKFIN